MSSIEVKSEIRQIKASWSREISQDLQHHGIDIDDFAKEIVKNIRRLNRQKSIKNIFSN